MWTGRERCGERKGGMNRAIGESLQKTGRDVDPPLDFDPQILRFYAIRMESLRKISRFSDGWSSNSLLQWWLWLLGGFISRQNGLKVLRWRTLTNTPLGCNAASTFPTFELDIFSLFLPCWKVKIMRCLYYRHMGVSKNNGTQQPWDFPTKNDHFGVFWGYHHLRKHPYIAGSPGAVFFKWSGGLQAADFLVCQEILETPYGLVMA